MVMSEESIIKKPIILCNLYDLMVQRLTEQMLSARNYELIFTRDSTEAIPQVPDAHLVISDVSNGGYKLYEHVIQTKPDIPIIFVDGGLMERERTPTALILDKPFKTKDLVALVEQHLKPTSGQ